MNTTTARLGAALTAAALLPLSTDALAQSGSDGLAQSVRSRDLSDADGNWEQRSDKPLVSRDGRHFVLVRYEKAPQRRATLFHDEHRYGPVDGFEPTSLVLSENGLGVAWSARDFDSVRIYHDDREVTAASDCRALSISPDGTAVAFVVADERGAPHLRIAPPTKPATPLDVRLNGTPLQPRTEIDVPPLLWSRDSSTVACGTDSEVVVASRRGWSFRVASRNPIFWQDTACLSADGERIAIGSEKALVVASREGSTEYPADGRVQGRPTFDAAGRVWYSYFGRNGLAALCCDGKVVSEIVSRTATSSFQVFLGARVAFDAGQRPVFFEERAGSGAPSRRVRIGEDTHLAVLQVLPGCVVLHPTGRIAYLASLHPTDHQSPLADSWVVDGEPGPRGQASQMTAGFLFSADGKHHAYPLGNTIVVDGRRIRGVEARFPAAIAPDSRHLYAMGSYEPPDQKTAGIVKIDLTTEGVEVLQHDAPGEIAQIVFEPKTGRACFLIAQGTTLTLFAEQDGRLLQAASAIQGELLQSAPSSLAPAGLVLRQDLPDLPQASCWWDGEGRLRVLGFEPKLGRVSEHVIEPAVRAPASPLDQLRIETSAGGSFALTDLRGKVVLLLFWSNGGPDLSAMQQISKLHTEHAASGLEIVGINIAGVSDAAMRMRERCVAKWSEASNGAAIAERFGIKATPQALLIDRNGAVVVPLSSARSPALIKAVERAVGGY